MAEIRIYGDPVLRKKAAAIERFDDALREFVERMIVDMHENDGVGLAAPQIGQPVRIAVVDETGGQREPYVLINPEITSASSEIAEDEEGCLSIPDIRLKVKRPISISVTAYNQNGEKVVIENAEGLLARALQHEIDHLDGILFVDRASPVARQLVSGKLKKLAKERRDKSSVS
jgi:peptide deformylase